MVLPIPPSNTTPIPNNPFYSPNSEYIQSASGLLIVGTGLQVDYTTGDLEVIVSATPVTSISSGPGISIIAGGGGAYQINNTGVLELYSGYGINITNLGDQRFQIATVGSQGTVTSVVAGPGLTGGVITTAGTIALRTIDPPVTGTYNYPQSLTVDNFGRVNSVTDGFAPIPISLFSGKGQLAVAVAPQSATALPPGPDGSVLIADTTCAEGMRWGPVTETAVACVQGIAPIFISGTQFEPFVNISPATLTTCGAVRLSNSTNSSSIDDALTAAAGCNLQQQINALAAFTGTVNNVTGSYPITITGNPTQAPNVEIAAASTSNAGAVQLNDTTTSTSVIEALTANQGRVLQQQINSLATNLGANLVGTIDGSTGNMITVTPAGTADGFVVGAPLLAPTPGIATAYAIVEVAGTMTPPGGVATAVDPGDWWFCDGADWIYLNVGVTPPTASETTPGIVELATPAEVQVGADATRAVTPAGLQSKLSNCCNLPSSTTIASSQALACVYNIALAGCVYATEFTAGNICLANTNETIFGTAINKAVTPAELKLKISDSPTLNNSDYIASSLALSTVNALAVGAVPKSTVTNKGQLLVGCQSGCVVNLPIATGDGCVLTSCGTSIYGMCWAPAAGGSQICGCTVGTITALGINATTLGDYSTVIGYNAGAGLTSDCFNTLVGFAAGSASALGWRNTSIGVAAGQHTAAACDNISVGYGAGKGGNLNVAIGSEAGSEFEQAENIAIGACAARFGTGGVRNTVIGSCAAEVLPASAVCNVVIGYSAAGSGIGGGWDGQGSVAIGACSQCSSNLSYRNVSVGAESLPEGGCCTTAIGYCAGYVNNIPLNSTYIGYQSGLNSSGDENVFIGNRSGYLSGGPSSLGCSTYVGHEAGYCVRNNVHSVAVGYQSGLAAAGLARSVSVGAFALRFSVTCADDVVAIGAYAGCASFNVLGGTFVGHCAGAGIVGSRNIAIGCEVGLDYFGCDSVLIGTRAGYQTYPPSQSNDCSVFIGYQAGRDFDNGFGNIAIGCNALAGGGGCCNIMLGRSTGSLSSPTKAIWIGNGLTSSCGFGTGTCTVVIGGGGYTYYNWGSWNNLSDSKFKTDIADTALGLNFINKLEPKQFTWCYPDEETSINGKTCIGVIAQDVLAAVASTTCAEHLGVVAGEETLFVAPTQFIWPLINAVKELSAENADLKSRLENIESRLSALEG